MFVYETYASFDPQVNMDLNVKIVGKNTVIANFYSTISSKCSTSPSSGKES